jgi:hypothetical protein
MIYRLQCSATVNGETLTVHQAVDAHAYDSDPLLREYTEKSLREALGIAIADKVKPKINKRRCPNS